MLPQQQSSEQVAAATVWLATDATSEVNGREFFISGSEVGLRCRNRNCSAPPLNPKVGRWSSDMPGNRQYLIGDVRNRLLRSVRSHSVPLATRGVRAGAHVLAAGAGARRRPRGDLGLPRRRYAPSCARRTHAGHPGNPRLDGQTGERSFARQCAIPSSEKSLCSSLQYSTCRTCA